MDAGVPVLSLASPEAQLVSELRASLGEWGFVGLVDHGLPDALLDRSYRAAASVFALAEEVKRSYEVPEAGRQRGYTPFLVEHAKDREVGDLKEFWHVGRAEASDLPRNVFPAEVPDFAPAMLALFDQLDAVALRVLAAVARGLDLPPDYFEARVRGGNSVLRVIHYPPLTGSGPAGAVRAAAHEDINLLTLLPVSTEPGLEILTRRGEWVALSPPGGTLVCDTGDMMQLLTGGRLPSTTHRVVNPVGEAARVPRYSLPFFVHPRPEVRLDRVDGSGPGPTAAEFLAERLRETGVS